MKSKNKENIAKITIPYLIIGMAQLVDAIVFMLPYRNYAGILKSKLILVITYVLFCIITIIILFKCKINYKKRNIMISAIFLIIVLLSGGYYYANLPQYTYKEAMIKVEKANHNNIAFYPETFDQRCHNKNTKLLSITQGNYYIYIKEGASIKIYEFNPYNGVYSEWKNYDEKEYRKMFIIDIPQK